MASSSSRFTRKHLLPDFVPFLVPCLCASHTRHDDLFQTVSFYEFPRSRGWTFHYLEESKHWHPPVGIIQNVSEETVQSKPVSSVSFELYRLDATGRAYIGSLEDEIGFLQEWMFFGLLLHVSKICGLEMDIEKDFLRKSGTGVIEISTGALNGLTERWLNSAELASSTNHHESPLCDAIAEKKALHSRMKSVRDTLMFITSLGQPNHINRTPRSSLQRPLTLPHLTVLLSIKILLRAIHTLLMSAPSPPDPDSDFKYKVRSMEYAVDGLPVNLHSEEVKELSYDQLSHRGWCPSEKSMMETTIGEGTHVEYVFYAGWLRRRRLEHRECTAMRCVATDVDETKYETAHVKQGCGCGHVKVNVDDVVAQLEKDEIPVVVISKNLELTVVKRSNRPYVAISHVWSHGLGNPLQNSLPLCQLKRLYNHICHLHQANPSLGAPSPDGSYALWIDSLLVPVGPHLKPFRTKAISQLGRVYADTAVLVVDRDLESHCSSKITVLERSLRIGFSDWMRRLWTLQEGMLAGKLFVQMSDFALPLSSPRPNVDEGRFQRSEDDQYPTIPVLAELVQTRVPAVDTLRLPSDAVSRMGSNYKRLLEAVQYRSTSKMSDEPLILSHLMGVNFKQIANCPDSERMAKFYVLVRDIPADIAFLDLCGQSIQHAPFRWAPSTLASLQSEVNFKDHLLEDSIAVCDEEGLHVECHGFVFSQETIDSMRRRPDFVEEKFCSNDATYDPRMRREIVTLVKPKDKAAVKWPRRPALLKNMMSVVLVDVLEPGWMGDEEGVDDKREPIVTVIAYGSFEFEPPRDKSMREELSKVGWTAPSDIPVFEGVDVWDRKWLIT